MQYLLAVQNDESVPPPKAEDFDKIVGAVMKINEEMAKEGISVFLGGLEPSSKAKTVNATKGDKLITDGPYLETKEVLGGFWVIDVADEKTALDWATRCSQACQNVIEVRAFNQGPDTYEEYLKSDWRAEVTR
jgi:hypothetical protein